MELGPAEAVRVLANDYFPSDASKQVFSDDEITLFLTLEGNVVKRAAAQAIDTIADNEALVSKVIETQGGLKTDGAKVADALRKRAAALRAQAVSDETQSDDGTSSEFISAGPTCTPELTEPVVTGWGLYL